MKMQECRLPGHTVFQKPFPQCHLNLEKAKYGQYWNRNQTGNSGANKVSASQPLGRIHLLQQYFHEDLLEESAWEEIDHVPVSSTETKRACLEMLCNTSEKEHVESCSCKLANPSVSQTLDELDFCRGIWTAALDGDESELLKWLEKRNIHPDARDSSGFTALHYASRNGHLNICQILIDHSASPNVQTKSGKVTPLHRAAYCGHTGIMKLLIQHGADATVQDADGKLALHKAAEKGFTEITEILLREYPAGKTVLDRKGCTPADCVPKNCAELKEILEMEENQSEKDFDTG